MTDYAGTINTDRIIWCCEQTQLGLPALARAVRTTPKKLEEGRLNHRQFARLAEYFGYPMLFFMQKGCPPKGAMPHVMFGAISARQDITFNPSLMRVINFACRHMSTYASLMEAWQAPVTFQPPALSGTLENKARQTREWLGVHKHAAYKFEGYRRLVEEKGILVIRSQTYRGRWQLDHPKVAGFCMPSAEVPLIFVKQTTPQMQTFTLFHELGHLLLHGGRGHIDREEALLSGDSEKKEQAANDFASRCLAPDFAFKKHKSLAQLRAGAKPVQKGIAPKEYRHLEPLDIFGEKYIRTLLKAVDDRELTLIRACNWLGGVPVAVADALKKHLAK